VSGRISTLLLGLILLIPGVAVAQDDAGAARREWVAAYRQLGIAAAVSFPYADYDKRQDLGYGLQGLVDHPLVPLINLTGTVGWTHFPGQDDRDAVDVFLVTFGGRLVLGSFYMSGETGYFSEIEEWGWVPGFGFRFDRLELGLRYVASGKDAWTTVRAGWYF